MAKWIHSIPAWTMNRRGANPKFQGGIELEGIASVADRLRAVIQLSRKTEIASQIHLCSSLHILHELKSRNSNFPSNPNAISFDDLKKGIKNHDFPHVLALTAPAFGFAGVEKGAILSPDSAIRRMAEDLHIEAIERAKELKEAGLGEEVVIWWPAFDSRRFNLINETPMSFKTAWKKLIDFWVKVLSETEGTVWLEWKPADPGIDYIHTLALAINFCNEVNKQFSRKAMYINNEWAHLLIGGVTVESGTKRTIKADLFTGFLHVNSAQLLPWHSEASPKHESFLPEQIMSGMDWDWAVGMGGQERWDDQEKAVAILDKCNAKTIHAEHDIDPAGQDPVLFAGLSIKNLETMISNVRKARS